MGQSPLLLSIHVRLKQFSDPILYLQGGCNFILCRPSQPMWNFFVFRSSSNSQSPLLSLSLSPLSPLSSRFIRFLSHRMENGDVVRKAFSVARARSLCTPRAFASFINRLLCCPISKLTRLLTGDVKVAQMSSSSGYQPSQIG